jgi:acetyl esterase/lipase
MMRNCLYVAAAVVALVAPTAASGDAMGKWQPPAGMSQIPLWPAGLAIAEPEITGPESVKTGGAIAGRPVTSIANVARPTMTIYPAKGRNTGAAVMVYPGGGYQILAIDLEGTEVCDWITARGIACVVVKYRVPQTWWPKDGGPQRAPKVQMALQDAERAISLLRQRAKALGIDSHKIGVLGFSAGGHLVTAISNATVRNYAPVDAADRESVRPDFAVALYPGHLWRGERGGRGMELYPFDTISRDAPPTFIVQAQDDPTDDVRNSITYFLALRTAKVPVEMHIYAKGGHAFGLRPAPAPITRWPALVERWLRTIGMI